MDKSSSAPTLAGWYVISLRPSGSHAPVRRFGHPDPQNPAQSIGQPDETSGQLYCIPNDNPWLSPAGARFEEYATIGHRNPHRLAKDPATGRLWAGEVGESTREEVNILQLGHNYGWPFREGKIAGPSPPPAPGTLLGILTEPIIEQVFDLPCRVITDPVSGTPLVLPIGRHPALT